MTTTKNNPSLFSSTLKIVYKAGHTLALKGAEYHTEDNAKKEVYRNMWMHSTKEEQVYIKANIEYFVKRVLEISK